MPNAALHRFASWILAALIAAPAFADPELQFGGRVELELGTQAEFRGADLDQAAVLDIETKRKNGIRAGSDIKLSVESGGLDLRELFVDYEADNSNRFLIGQAKKRFGLGWDMGEEERLALSRGVIYKKLLALNYVGRDATAGYRMGRDASSLFAHDVSFHSANGLNASLLYKIEKKFDENSFFASYSLAQSNRISSEWSSSGAQAFSYSGFHGPLRLEGELFVGKDSIESDFYSRNGVNRTVLFSAATLGASRRFSSFEPFLRSSILMNDISALGKRTLELTSGTKVHLQPRLELGGELNLIRSNSSESYGFDSSSGMLLSLRYFF